MPRLASATINLPTLTSLVSLGCALMLCQAAAAADLVASTADELQERFAGGARYVIGSETSANPHPWCTEIARGNVLLENDLIKPYAQLAGHAAAKLLECDYKFPGSARRGWVIVLAATPRNLAERMVNACNEVAPGQAKACVDKLMDSGDDTAPAGSNSFIFPITGFVREPCNGNENLIGFRHGVTIQYTDGPASKNKLAYCVTTNETADTQRKVGLTFGTFDVFKVGRLAAVTRANVAVDGSFPEPDEGSLEGLASDAFQVYVRDNEIRAVETAHDRMMVIKAALKMGVQVPAKQ
ncbi:hypothetical protein NKI96_21295 [Mesorhizobium sp. M0292]|uniref:hypothetical protein n=1 Tax=unclassified Mesorhizobium TaxID=325217 RepID=UPI00333B00BF